MPLKITHLGQLSYQKIINKFIIIVIVSCDNYDYGDGAGVRV